METDLQNTNRILTEKLDRLIEFLKVCPQCLQGYLKERGYHPMTAQVIDTWTETIQLYCSNKQCSHSIKKANPNYQPRVSIGQDLSELTPRTEKRLDDQFDDLFG